MPEQAEPPSPRQPGGPSAALSTAAAAPTGPAARHTDAVLFDFQGTLAQVEDAVSWVRAAAAECGLELAAGAATVLADRLVTAGRAGGPLPARVPPHLIEVWAERDLYPYAHRAAYTGLAATVEAPVEGLPDALYDRLLVPEGWLAYSDAVETLTALREAGKRIGLVSNIGFDVRPLLDFFGLGDLIDVCVLSYEVGRLKPDPAIFRHACKLLDVEPEATLMVGDTPHDAAAVAVGCTAYVVPAAGPGLANGLAAVRALTCQDAEA